MPSATATRQRTEPTARSRQIHLPRLHPAQQEIRTSAKRFNVAALGRRTGKSTLAQDLLVETLLAGQPAAYMTPTYKLLQDFWRQLKNTLRPVIVSKSEDEHRLEILGGGVVDCWSTDSGDPARGRKYARVILDEAAMIPDLLSLWGQAIRPTLADLHGDGWFFSTPKGLNGFHAYYQRGQDPLYPEWASWQMPTAVNPYIDSLEIADARADSTERDFQQEWLAKFLTDTGVSVFRGVEAVSRLQPLGPQRGHQYVLGVDWGRSGDFTCFSVLDLTTAEQVAMERMTEVSYDLQTARLHGWAALYKPSVIVAETNSMGGPLVERLQQGYQDVFGKSYPPLPVWGWNNSNASKHAAVSSLSLQIERGAVTLLADSVQQGELMAFEESRTATGLVRYSAPPGMHDDTVIALMLGCLASVRAEDGRSRTGSYAFGGRR
jgi:hypothetical protein